MIVTSAIYEENIRTNKTIIGSLCDVCERVCIGPMYVCIGVFVCVCVGEAIKQPSAPSSSVQENESRRIYRLRWK